MRTQRPALRLKARRSATAGVSGQTKDHGWFVAFAPYTDPEIAIVVIAEHAGFGGVAAAPVARAVLEAAFAHPREQEKVAQGPGARE